jgi:hypothetical protein
MGHSGALGVPGIALVVHTPIHVLRSLVKISPFWLVSGSLSSDYYYSSAPGLGPPAYTIPPLIILGSMRWGNFLA